MKTKSPTLEESINTELNIFSAELQMKADRFRDKAADLALDLLQRPDQDKAKEKRQLAHDHMIRVEAFREAASYIAPKKPANS